MRTGRGSSAAGGSLLVALEQQGAASGGKGAWQAWRPGSGVVGAGAGIRRPTDQGVRAEEPAVAAGGDGAGVLQAAYREHPVRFVQRVPRPPEGPSQVWINKPEPVIELGGVAH